jgi:hypothetical protein
MVMVQLEPLSFQRPRRLARPRTPPFHGDNKSSNLFGDTNKSLMKIMRAQIQAAIGKRQQAGCFDVDYTIILIL